MSFIIVILHIDVHCAMNGVGLQCVVLHTVHTVLLSITLHLILRETNLAYTAWAV